MSESLWPEEINGIDTNNATYEILEEQAEYISKQTQGKVKCFFEKIQYNITNMSNLGKILTSYAENSIGSELVEEELQSKQDVKKYINPNKGKYKFELYSDMYRYRLFTYTYSIYFPNELELDDSICEELNLPHSIIIESNADLKSILKKVFASINVRTALHKMIQ